MLKNTLTLLTGLISLSSFADSPTLNARLAYQAPGSSVVQIQGDTGNTGLGGLCKPLAERCDCMFTTTKNDGLRKVTPVTAVSIENGTVSCRAPSSDTYSLVTVRSPSHGSTAPLQIVSKLSIQDVLGSLSVSKVNKVYKYTCERTFFEGEGVSTSCEGGSNSCINCLTNVQQRLGLITASYDYYLFDNQEGGGNKSSKFVASYFPGICGRPDAEFARANCSASTPETRYGLYNQSAGPFNIRVQMVRAPEQLPGSTDLMSTYGYAASPDISGNCPIGLEKARPYIAQPASIVEGSVDGLNPPSNFLNTGDGMLNNTVVDTYQPLGFSVRRQASETPCSLVTGSCANATFGGVSEVQNVEYTALTPTICVLPRSLLDQIK